MRMDYRVCSKKCTFLNKPCLQIFGEFIPVILLFYGKSGCLMSLFMLYLVSYNLFKKVHFFEQIFIKNKNIHPPGELVLWWMYIFRDNKVGIRFFSYPTERRWRKKAGMPRDWQPRCWHQWGWHRDRRR